MKYLAKRGGLYITIWCITNVSFVLSFREKHTILTTYKIAHVTYTKLFVINDIV